MKGIVFNLLEEIIQREYGEDTWDALLEAAQIDGVYTSLGNYPDEDMMKLVSAASAALNLPPEAVVRWFGRKAIPLLADRYPLFFRAHKSTRSFLLTLNNIIHPEVRKIYPGADVPEFDFDTASEEVLVMGYKSPRRLCALAQGFVEGAAGLFCEEAMIEETQCMHRGDEKCVFRISFQKQEAG